MWLFLGGWLLLHLLSRHIDCHHQSRDWKIEIFVSWAVIYYALGTKVYRSCAHRRYWSMCRRACHNIHAVQRENWRTNPDALPACCFTSRSHFLHLSENAERDSLGLMILRSLTSSQSLSNSWILKGSSGYNFHELLFLSDISRCLIKSHSWLRIGLTILSTLSTVQIPIPLRKRQTSMPQKRSCLESYPEPPNVYPATLSVTIFQITWGALKLQTLESVYWLLILQFRVIPTRRRWEEDWREAWYS